MIALDTTTNLALPYIAQGQAQKHVTHNEAIRMLNAIVQLAVIERSRSAPPDHPEEGDRYIVGSAGEGAWSGSPGRIAAWQDGHWMIHAPVLGWLAWIAAESRLVVWTGSTWADAATPVSAATLGINATADSTNRLAVAADATLLSHDGAGHQLKINKAAASETGSLVFQTSWSGRAEMGLAGDDDFRIKVSADGTVWREALTVAGATGRLGVGTGEPQGCLQCRLPAGDNGLAFVMTGQGRTGPDDNAHGAAFVLSHNAPATGSSSWATPRAARASASSGTRSTATTTSATPARTSSSAPTRPM